MTRVWKIRNEDHLQGMPNKVVLASVRFIGKQMVMYSCTIVSLIRQAISGGSATGGPHPVRIFITMISSS